MEASTQTSKKEMKYKGNPFLCWLSTAHIGVTWFGYAPPGDHPTSDMCNPLTHLLPNLATHADLCQIALDQYGPYMAIHHSLKTSLEGSLSRQS